MPRYFIDVHHRDSVARETEGQELPDLAAAREEAFASARQMIAGAILTGSSLREALRGTVAVRDDAGVVLLSVGFMGSVRASTAPAAATNPM